MTHPMRIACATLAVVACASCQPPETESVTNTTAPPVVGRLQLHDRVLDLTVESFGAGPNAVPNHAYAKANVMADVAPTKPESEPARADVARPRMPNER